jgi:hypothetical protein
MNMRHIILSVLFILAMPIISSGQNPLLPTPQKANYGKGTFEIASASISFGHHPVAEDSFAAETLADILSEISGANIMISDTEADNHSIILVRTGNIDALPRPNENAGLESREAYQIRINPGEAELASGSTAGLFYAVQTLLQLVEGTGKEAILPECEIRDWPEMPYRGFMMDMSHTQLPKIEEIKKQIDFLARWKANQYYFYTEASIELDGYPLLMANARYKKEEVREVIEYARKRHIDVIPLMELYGHIHDLFRLEHYADMAVMPHGGEFKPYDPRVKPIIEDWISQMSVLFPSPFFHIGFDETWLIRSEAEKLKMPPEKLYLDMLNQTADIVVEQGKIPMLFADMLQKFPMIIPEISNRIIAVPWHYFPKDESAYDPLLAPFHEQGIPMIVQSALINWNWVYPAFEISFRNTDLLLRMGKKYGAVGFINSGWTDDTQTIMRLSWPDLAFGSAQSWHREKMDHTAFFKKYTSALYPVEVADHVRQALIYLMEGESLLRKSLGPTDPAFFANPFAENNLKLIKTNAYNLRNGRLAVEKAQIHIMDALKHEKNTKTLFAMLTGAKMLDYLALKYIYAGEISDLWVDLQESENINEKLDNFIMEVSFKYHTRTQDMLDAIIELKEMYKKAWLNEYHTFRLGVGLGKYDLEFQYWLKMQRRMDEFCRQYEPNAIWPSLESLYE